MSYTNGLDKPTDYFNTKLYTGNGGTNAITGVGFQPDWVWIKQRDIAENHETYDAVRGVTKALFIDQTGAEATKSTGLTSFNSDGFSLGNRDNVNKNSGSYASWNWLGANGTASNSNGSITSTVSANTTAGFSIVSWTGNGSNGATIGHGLGVTPAIVITKRRSAVGDWLVGGSLIDTVRGGANSLLLLNGTNAMDSNSEVYQTFSSTTFQVGTNEYANTSGSTMISYCFAEKKGFSKFGSYTGNGNADGTFIYTGFKPAFFLVKRSDSTTSWTLLDNKRDPFNVTTERLFPNEAVAGSVGTNANTDFLSNGVKIRVNHNNFNTSGGSYIYMAFAEQPFVTSTGIPTTAR